MTPTAISERTAYRMGYDRARRQLMREIVRRLMTERDACLTTSHRWWAYNDAILTVRRAARATRKP